jgi:flagellar basal-body rod protein FlgC
MKIYGWAAVIWVLTLGWSAPKAGLENALDISASGAIAQRVRAQVIADNIANIDTTKTSDGLPYRRKVVVLRPAENFSRSARTSRMMLQGVQVASVGPEPDAEQKFQQVYKPGHPDANSSGFVYYPNIDLAAELVELSEVGGAFENNVVVFNNTKAMMQASLELAQ